MADMLAKSPMADLPRLTIGTVTLEEVDLGHLTCIAPLKGQADAVANTMGRALPAPNRATGKEGDRLIWFGREIYLLAGSAPEAQVADHAAVTDQSDAWACAALTGLGAEDVLARLVPIDLRAAHFKRGHTARTELAHMHTSITRVGADRFLILVFRSMARTLHHDLKIAMESVAARP